MDIQGAIQAVTSQQDLTSNQMIDVMRLIMSGHATPAQVGGFLIGLRMKGETVDEIIGAVTVMRELATKVNAQGPYLVDTCGTGGDGKNTFNISTACAFVVSAAGAKVAKHGNRSITSQSGSADVLEVAGVNINLDADQVSHCINTLGIGFMFAPLHHGAMKHAIGPRREMKVRTIFNLLGPLTNPAGAPSQLIGVFSDQWLRPLAEVLLSLGSQHVLLVNGQDGMDEISISAPTNLVELKQGIIEKSVLRPEDFGISPCDINTILVESKSESLEVIYSVFDGEPGPARDIVVLNAGAAIYAADLAESLISGVEIAKQILDDKKARLKLDALVKLSSGF